LTASASTIPEPVARSRQYRPGWPIDSGRPWPIGSSRSTSPCDFFRCSGSSAWVWHSSVCSSWWWAAQSRGVAARSGSTSCARTFSWPPGCSSAASPAPSSSGSPLSDSASAGGGSLGGTDERVLWEGLMIEAFASHEDRFARSKGSNPASVRSKGYRPHASSGARPGGCSSSWAPGSYRVE